MDISGIDYLGIDRVLKRGSGEITLEKDDVLIVHDNISDAYFLACEDSVIGMKALDEYIPSDCKLLMVSNYYLGKMIYEKYDYSGKVECYQVAYYKEKPELKLNLDIRVADESDLSFFIENYHQLDPKDQEKIIERRKLYIAYYQDQIVGFIGEHLEGSMGILYVFPTFRHKGYGIELEKYLICKTIEEGYIPFGQVDKDNIISLNIQKKLGMIKSNNLIIWMRK